MMVVMPQEVYEAMADMSNAELKVTLYLLANTVSVGAGECRATYGDLMGACGLSKQGISDGVKAVIEREFFSKKGRSKWAVNKLSTSYPQDETVYLSDQNGLVIRPNGNGAKNETVYLSDQNGLVIRPNENETVYLSDQNGLVIRPKQPPYIHTYTTTTNNNINTVVVSPEAVKKNREALKAVGVRGPKVEELAVMPHVNPDYIWAIAHQTFDIEKQKVGLFVHRVRCGDAAANFSKCRCQDPQCKARRIKQAIPEHLKNIIKR